MEEWLRTAQQSISERTAARQRPGAVARRLIRTAMAGTADLPPRCDTEAGASAPAQGDISRKALGVTAQ